MTKIISRLPNKCSAGLDGIPHIIIKHLPHRYRNYLVIILNNMLNNKYFPRAWKCAKILPVLKPGKNPHELTSCCPISLTCNFSKLLEIIIDNSIETYCKKNNIIPETQFGFQRKLSTCHAINTALTIINKHLNENEVVGACFIDIEKAFDSAWIDGLIFLLIQLKFPIFLIHMIYDMITNKTFKIWDGELITTIIFLILEGLHQGTVTSPKLFNISTRVVLLLFTNETALKKYTIAFADDLKIMVAHKNPLTVQKNLEKMLHEVNQFYHNWNLRINPGKCETIFYHRPRLSLTKTKRKGLTNFSITFRNLENNTTQDIAHKKTFKYLGVHLDHLLRMNKHVNIQLEKAKACLRKYSRLMHCSSLQPRAKIILYMLLRRPILTYAAPVWWNISASLMEKLRMFERKCLRTALFLHRCPNSKKSISNKIIYKIANIPRIDNFIIKLTRNYLAQLKNIDNKTVKSVTGPCLNVEEKAKSGYFPPQYFTHFDNKGIIQDHNNLRLIYHYPRHVANKAITYIHKNGNYWNTKYDTSLPPCDYKDKDRLKNKHWWLDKHSTQLTELARRVIKR